MDFCLSTAGYNHGCRMLIMRVNSHKSSREARWTYDVCCFASKRHGFGSEPTKKEKNDSTKNKKESLRSTSEPSTFLTGESNAKAPQLTSSSGRSSGNVVLDQQFLDKVEAVKRSALEQKKAEEKKIYQAIDYDAPIESDKSTVGFGTKVGIGVAVLLFGLVFAFGDFLPYGSFVPSEDASIGRKELTEQEKMSLQRKLEGYLATLNKSPEDPTALEGTVATLEELGDYVQASSLLEKLTNERPNNAEAYRLLGDVKFELKDYDGSASAYSNSLSVSKSSDFKVLVGLTNSLLAAKKPSEAVQVLLKYRDQLNEENMKESDNYVNGNINVDEKTQKADPVKVGMLLGKAYSDWGHVSDAVAVYDQLISEYPNDFRGYLAKGIILKENGSAGDAERMFIQARFIAPEKAKSLVDRYSLK